MSRHRLVGLGAVVVLMTAACGGSGGAGGIASLESDPGAGTATSAATGTTVDTEQAMLDFAQCMRDQGIDMADPVPNEDGHYSLRQVFGGGTDRQSGSASREATRAAREACAPYLEGVTQQFARPDATEMQDLMVEYAACMRENGVDMPDPDFASEGSGGQGPGSRLGFNTGDYDRSDPTFQAADEACREIFGGSNLPGFLGGGPGGDGPPADGVPPEGSAPPDTSG